MTKYELSLSLRRVTAVLEGVEHKLERLETDARALGNRLDAELGLKPTVTA